MQSEYIAYRATSFSDPNQELLDNYGVEPFQYNMLIARLEPENNIHTILKGISEFDRASHFLVVGKHDTKYGNYLKEQFSAHGNIRFMGGIYNLEHLNNLRYFSNLYFHGHSAGGTQSVAS